MSKNGSRIMRHISGRTVLIGVTVSASGCADQRIYDSAVCSHGNVFAFIMVVHKAAIRAVFEWNIERLYV
jgi:hypothetical protein